MPTCRFCDETLSPGIANCPSCGAEHLFVEGKDEARNLEGDLIELIDHGRTIEAIKLYRDVTGAGLAEAKRFIDALIENRWSPSHGRSKSQTSNGDIEQVVLELMKQGRKIEAIKFYRERTGAGLKEAKEAVESLATQHGIAAKNAGCLTVALVLASSAAVSSYLMA